MSNSRKQLGTSLEKQVVAKANQRPNLAALSQPLSGALYDFPADVVLTDAQSRTLIECKVRAAHLTVKGEKHFTIDLHWINKVRAEAVRDNADAFAVALRAKGSSQIYALIDLDFLLDLLNKKGKRR